VTRGQIKTNININLQNAGSTFHTDSDLNDSLQDAYDDIAVLTQCITNTVDLNWVAGLSYYNFKDDFGLSDYLGATAIFNYDTNRWLRDDLSIRDFDRLRRDWETWTGATQFWASSDFKRIAIAPHVTTTTTGTTSGAFYSLGFSSGFFIGISTRTSGFQLTYWAQAPPLTGDGSTFLIATDMQDLLEFYATADQLETSEEFTKANEYWEKYYSGIKEYAERVKRNNKSDLLLRV
jgi:hypothetical protein